jgi:ribosomal-protein-alanine N-acetyltransferase
MPPLQTSRLTIRELVAADQAAVERLAGGDRERWLRWTMLAYEQLDELRQPPYGERAVVLRESGELIGLVGLVPSLGPFGLLPGWPEPGRLHRPEVGLYWEVAPPHRRRGFAAEAAVALIDHAFTEVGLARVVATTEHDNLASRHAPGRHARRAKPRARARLVPGGRGSRVRARGGARGG